MSWTISFSGTPEEVVTKLEEHASTYGGQSKEEYERALPHMVGLVKLNLSAHPTPIRIVGVGSSTTNPEGVPNDSYCRVSIVEHDPLV
jgi:hypothetical protein